MIHYLIRFSPSIVFFAWAVAASSDGVATTHIVFLVLLSITFILAECERIAWKRRRRK